MIVRTPGAQNFCGEIDGDSNEQDVSKLHNGMYQHLVDISRLSINDVKKCRVQDRLISSTR